MPRKEASCYVLTTSRSRKRRKGYSAREDPIGLSDGDETLAFCSLDPRPRRSHHHLLTGHSASRPCLDHNLGFRLEEGGVHGILVLRYSALLGTCLQTGSNLQSYNRTLKSATIDDTSAHPSAQLDTPTKTSEAREFMLENRYKL